MYQCTFNVNANIFFFLNLIYRPIQTKKNYIKVPNFACLFNVAGALKVLPILKINHINNLFILI